MHDLPQLLSVHIFGRAITELISFVHRDSGKMSDLVSVCSPSLWLPLDNGLRIFVLLFQHVVQSYYYPCTKINQRRKACLFCIHTLTFLNSIIGFNCVCDIHYFTVIQAYYPFFTKTSWVLSVAACTIYTKTSSVKTRTPVACLSRCCERPAVITWCSRSYSCTHLPSLPLSWVYLVALD